MDNLTLAPTNSPAPQHNHNNNDDDAIRQAEEGGQFLRGLDTSNGSREFGPEGLHSSEFLGEQQQQQQQNQHQYRQEEYTMENGGGENNNSSTRPGAVSVTGGDKSGSGKSSSKPGAVAVPLGALKAEDAMLMKSGAGALAKQPGAVALPPSAMLDAEAGMIQHKNTKLACPGAVSVSGGAGGKDDQHHQQNAKRVSFVDLGVGGHHGRKQELQKLQKGNSTSSIIPYTEDSSSREFKLENRESTITQETDPISDESSSSHSPSLPGVLEDEEPLSTVPMTNLSRGGAVRVDRESSVGAFPEYGPDASISNHGDLSEVFSESEGPDSDDDEESSSSQPMLDVSTMSRVRDSTQAAAAAAATGMSVAFLVSSEAFENDDEPRQSAVQINPQEEQEQKTLKQALMRRKTVAYLLGAALFLIIIIITVVVAAAVGRKKNPNNQDTIFGGPGGTTTITTNQTTSLTPTQAPLMTAEDTLLSLLPKETQSIIRKANPEAPQVMAYEWMIQDPNFDNYTNPYRLIQRYALATLYYATGGNTTWQNNDDWLDYEVHECFWWSSHAHGFYEYPETESVLLYNFTTDTVTSCSSVTNHSSNHYEDDSGAVLEHLWLKVNGLQGTIPEELYLLTSLKSISMERNELQGTLSSKVGKLINLEALGLYRTELTGTLPPQIGRSTQLEFLWLMADQISGTLPTELGLLSDSLVYLAMDTNELVGSIPTQVGHLSKLEWLWLWSNVGMTGTIPTQVGNIEAMYSLAIGHSLHTGTVPSELGRLTHSTKFHFNNMLLTGTLPSELGIPTLCWSLLFSSNMITGTLPTEFGQLIDMWFFHGLDTLITGTIPSQIGQWQRWPWVTDLSYIPGLMGSIPSQIGLMLGMQHFRVDNSDLSGTIPTQLGRLTGLDTLQLHSNRLSGQIPSEFGALDIPNEEYFDEETNTTYYPGLRNLLHLTLHSNALTGSVPTQLGQLKGLNLLTIQNNRGLIGTVPQELCELDSWQSIKRPLDWWELGAGRWFSPTMKDMEGAIYLDCEHVDCNCSSICICK